MTSDYRMELGKMIEFLDEHQLSSSKTVLEDEIKQRKLVPIHLTNNKIQYIKDAFEEYDSGAFWKLWGATGLADNEIEFFLQIYFCFSSANKSPPIDEEAVKNGQTAFKQFIENREETTLPESDEFQIYFGLPYIPKPHLKSQYAHIFTPDFNKKVMNRLLRFLKTSSLSLRDKETLLKQNQLFEQLTKKCRKQETDIRRLELDYGNILQLSLELMDLLQASVKGETVKIGDDIIERLSSRLVSRSRSSIFPDSSLNTSHNISPLQASTSPVPVSRSSNGVHVIKTRYDFTAIKKDMFTKGQILKALRLKLTKSTNEMERMKIMNEYIYGDILACTHPSSIHHKNVIMLLTSTKLKLRETLHRFINTLASVFPGRSYLANSHLLVPALEEAFFHETKPLCREHLLGSLQKLSLRRALQSQMIKTGKLIPWLVNTLAEPDNLSDYVLEYSAALLMNLCLRTKGRYSLINEAEKTLRVLSDLLSHENQSFKAYLNGSLYSVLAIKEFKDIAKEMGLDALLTSLMKEDQIETENYGQLEYIKQQIMKPAEAVDEDSDDENGEEEEDADEQEDFEADLDLADCLPTLKYNILEDYVYTDVSRSVKMTDFNPRESKDHFLRPTTPGQRKLNIEERDSIVIGESVNIDLTDRSKTEFIGDEHDLEKVVQRKNTFVSDEKENNPNHASISTKENITRVVPNIEVHSAETADSLEEQFKKPGVPDGYRDVFGPKPKIPRTPDVRTSGNN